MYRYLVRSAVVAAAFILSCQLLCSQANAETFRLGLTLPGSSPTGIASINFADLVRKRTKGEVDILVFADSQLGNDEDLIRDLSRGALDFSFSSTGSANGLDPLLEFGQIPYLVSNYSEADKIIFGDGVVRKTLTEALAKYNIHLISQFELEFRQMSNSVRPIRSVEDMKGLRIRVPPSRSLRAFVKAIGAQPVTVPFAEMFAALQQGLVDGQENGPVLLYTSKTYEAQKYLTLLRYQYAFGTILVSETAWNRLSPDNQKIIADTANEVSLSQRELNRANVKEYTEKLKQAGIQVIEELSPEEQKKFQEIGRSTWEQHVDAYGQERIDALLAEVAKLN